jgi:hypothetical protein
MRICIIGNSHAACLKLAWDKGLSKKHPSAQFVFFASLTAGIETLTAHDQSLKSHNPNTIANFKITSNGLDEIEFSSFDYCLLHGLSPRTMAYRKMILSSRKIFYSQYALALSNPFHQSLAFRLINEIRKISEIPIICSPTPNALSALNAPKEEKLDKLTFGDVCSTIELSHKQINAIYLPQPSSTIHCTYFTAPKYGKGPKNLLFRSGDSIENGDLFENDSVHMNEAFGKKLLEKILRRTQLDG